MVLAVQDAIPKGSGVEQKLPLSISQKGQNPAKSSEAPDGNLENTAKKNDKKKDKKVHNSGKARKHKPGDGESDRGRSASRSRRRRRREASQVRTS